MKPKPQLALYSVVLLRFTILLIISTLHYLQLNKRT